MLEMATLFPVGAYVGMWPLFKYLKKNKKHGEMWYSLVFSTVYRFGEKPIREIKEKLFKDLVDEVSLIEELKADGAVRILEIGPGFGGNFKFYPPNTLLTTVEIQEYLEKNTAEIREQYPNITFERCLIANAENMTEVPDNSVDVVVGTLILCCIDDTKAALSEIRRVLVKVRLRLSFAKADMRFCHFQGGKFYFCESVSHPEGTFKHKMQKMYRPFWHGFTLR